MKPYYEKDGIAIYHADCADWLASMPKGRLADAMITDPPYGVELVARITKHSVRKASTTYQDDAEYIRQVIVPRVTVFLSRVTCAAITSGGRNAWAYPEPVDLGCVFCSRWRWKDCLGI